MTIAVILLAMIVAGPFPAAAQDDADPAFDCYDALVSARIVRQVPSAYPDCGDGCIIMSWPWFIDLDVRRVLDGALPNRKLSVLTIQHTSFRSRIGYRRWLFRRNALGGYNATTFFEPKEVQRCDPGMAPMKPYLHPSDGRTLDDLRREGEALYNSEH
jgi:hypothetical protein